jgi:hypothetical protein
MVDRRGMILVMAETEYMEALWLRTRRDQLALRLYRDEPRAGPEPIFTLAVHTKHRDEPLIIVRTKNIESAACKILDEYRRIKPDEAAA